jgi:hypothetical protein
MVLLELSKTQAKEIFNNLIDETETVEEMEKLTMKCLKELSKFEFVDWGKINAFTRKQLSKQTKPERKPHGESVPTSSVPDR